MTRVSNVVLVALMMAAWCGVSRGGDPIKIAAVTQEGDISFEKQVLPVLRKKCLACHNSSDAESDLVLESPSSMIKGGSLGPAVVPGKSAESLLLKVAAHQDEPIMPPEDNDVDADNLTPNELGVLKLWIDQGATGSVSAAKAIAWQPLPQGVNPIYATAISADGVYVAAGRANQVAIYHVPSQREVARLTDPAIMKSGVYDKPGVAHLDLVQALAFHPAGNMIATGGYRTVKLWERPTAPRLRQLENDSPLTTVAVTTDRETAVWGDQQGHLILVGKDGVATRRWKAHEGKVLSAAWLKDGSMLISSGDDGLLKQWSTDKATLLNQFQLPAVAPAVAALDESTVALGVEGNTVAVWKLGDLLMACEAPPRPERNSQNVAVPQPTVAFKGHGDAITALRTVPGKPLLISASKDGTIRIWDINQKKMLRQLSHGSPVLGIDVKHDGLRLVSIAENRTGRIWDLNNGKQIVEFKGDFRGDFAVASQDRAVKLAASRLKGGQGDLDAAKKRKDSESKNTTKSEEDRKKAEEELKKKEEELKKPTTDKQAGDKKLADAKAAVTDGESQIKAADAEIAAADKAIKKDSAGVQEQTKQIAMLKQQRDSLAKLAEEASAAADQEAENEELAQKKSEAAKQHDAANQTLATAEKQLVEHQQQVAARQKDKQTAQQKKNDANKQLATAKSQVKASEGEIKKLTDALTKATDARDTAKRNLDAAVRAVERSKVMLAKADQSVKETETIVAGLGERQKAEAATLDETKKKIQDNQPQFTSVAFSADGSLVTTGCSDGRLLTWNVEKGIPCEKFVGGGPCLALHLNQAGQICAGTGADGITVWQTFAPWKLVRTIGDHSDGEAIVDRVTALAFSRDGKRLATGSGEPSRSGELKLWNVSTGELEQHIPEAHSDSVFGLEFSREGDQLASCGADRFVKLFDVSTGKFIRSFEGHTGHVLGVTFRADGRLLASCGADNVVKIWDAITGDQKRTIQGFRKEVTSVRFVGDSGNVLIVCGDKSVAIKNADSGGNVRSFSGAADYMYAGSSSADGKLIVAAGYDSTVRVWQDNGQLVTTFK